MKKLPLSIQTFEDIIKGKMIYVDKTEYIWKLANSGKYYFLSRPRRFGKSMLISTLKSYFKGHKHLFDGLFIAEKEQEWKEYPVIHIDYSLVTYSKERAIFEDSLLFHLKRIAKDYKVTLKEKIIGNALSELVENLHEKYDKVVILVDEYDKPIIDHLKDEAQSEQNRQILRKLYGVLKGLDNYLRFVFLTGVSRFSKVGVFSGMNNLTDISEHYEYATVVGFTQEELEQNFAPYFDKLKARFSKIPADELMEKIKFWYNGFSFDGNIKLYNPFSVLALCNELEFKNYWFSTGTPTFLIDLITEKKELPETFEGQKVTDLTGSTTQIKDLPLIPLLYQTGYLTIKDTEDLGILKYYILDYPNEEVRRSFITYIAAAFMQKNEINIQPVGVELVRALYEERTEDFVQHLQSFLADIPARLHIEREAYYHSLVYMMLRLAGVQTLLEKETSTGRIDAVAELPDKIYIIEFKFGKPKGRIKNVKTLSQKAIKQIEAQKYAEPYLNSNKKIILFGMGFLNKELHGRVKVISKNMV